MSKREHAAGVADNDAEVRRAKRRKEGSGSSAAVEDVEMSDAEDNAEPNGINSDGLSKEVIREHGLKVWQVVKDAVAKECVVVTLAQAKGKTTTKSYLRRSLLCFSPFHNVFNCSTIFISADTFYLLTF